jgi:hypothetical protein
MTHPEHDEHRVGEYFADYSDPSQAQIVAPELELYELFRASETVSIKRES